MPDWKFLAKKYLGAKRRDEPLVKREMSGWSGNVFVDIGANIGDYTVLTWRRYYRNVAFEPNWEVYKKLQSRIGWRKPFHYFQLHNCAVSDIDVADARLYSNNGFTCDTLEKDFHYRPASHAEVEGQVHGDRYSIVEARTLDSYEFPEKTDFKIDVEGSEFRVLDGGRRVLSEAGRVMVELHDRERADELGSRLESLGLKTFWIDADHLQGSSLKYSDGRRRTLQV